VHRQAAAVLSIVVLVVGGAGCSGSAAHSTTPGETSGSSPAIPPTSIRGTAELIGGPWPGRRPLANVTIHVLAGGQVVGLVQTDEHGRFSLPLPPGTYHVELSGDQELLPVRVSVAASGTTHLSLKQYAK
jgi:hypothetical protein